ncbi:MAG: YraN family protein [Patescibacteria group bacterium]|nr:YraN family protein [Patescibacteria group bacterium]
MSNECQILNDKKTIGNLGEKLACNHLKKLSYIILDKNFRSRYGEIDIIAKDGEAIVFVEVKTRTNLEYGQPQEAVDFFKLKKMAKTIYNYISLNNIRGAVRIDVVAINLDMTKRKARLRHFKDALAEY